MKLFYVFLLGLVLGTVGCAHMQPTVTGSSAPFSVRRDIAHLMVYVDAEAAPDCKERRSITVEPLPSDKPGVTVERWRVKRCDTVKAYRVTFVPTPEIGGYDYSFKAED